MGHGHHHEIAPPKPLELPAKFTQAAIACIGLGVLAFIAAFFIDSDVAWKGYIIGMWFSMGLALIGPFFVSTQHLSIAGWSVPMRRIPEAFGAFIPVVGVLAIVGVLLIPDTVFLWKHPNALQDSIFAKKAGFLNTTGMLITTVLSFGVLSALWFIMRKLSLRQDEEGGYAITNKLKVVSALYLIAFTTGVSFLSWYWLMSLEPNWFSTMWSVYTFAGMFQCGLAIFYVLTLRLGQAGHMGSFVGGRQVHDLGKMVFGFTTFYAYIGFCQFLLIWYANIPEEDVWYIQRLTNGWAGFLLALPFIKFIIPFLIMLPQKIKKNQDNVMYFLCMWLPLAQLYEVWFWVEPQPHGLHMEGAHGAATGAGFSLLNAALEFGIALGFIGAFALVAGRAMAKHPLVPIKDPFLHETLPHHTHEAPLLEQASHDH